MIIFKTKLGISLIHLFIITLLKLCWQNGFQILNKITENNTQTVTDNGSRINQRIIKQKTTLV